MDGDRLADDRPAWQEIAQDAADHIRRKTGVSYVLVVFCDGSTTIVGAQVPSVELLRDIALNLAESICEGTARIVDRRKS